MAKNKLLVEFGFITDMDFAVLRFLKDNNGNNIFNEDILNLDDMNLIGHLLDRETINPIEMLVDNDEYDVTDLYNEICNTDSILKYIIKNDIFGLMVTYSKMAAVDITYLCDNKAQKDYLLSINPNFNVVVSDRENINTSRYDVFYIKFYINALRYNNLIGKNVYIANARYNIEPGKRIPKIGISAIVGEYNKVILMDPYIDIKFIPEGEVQ